MSYRYHEKQFLGYNRFGLIRRMVVTLFCFLFYFISAEKNSFAELFFYLGLALLFISAGAMLISHLETRLEGTTLHLIGPMTFKEVYLDLNGAHSAVVKPFSRFFLNRPMFNLHRKGSVRFYTHGTMCVSFVLANGEVIRLGTQRPKDLLSALADCGVQELKTEKS